MANVRQAQTGIKVEAVEGTPETLGAADFALNTKNTDHVYSAPPYARELDIGVMSRLKGLKGPRTLTVKGTAEFAGGSVTTPPKCHDILLGCGFARTTIKKVTSSDSDDLNGWQTGDLFGNNASQAAATKTGIFIAALPNGSGFIYHPLGGTLANLDSLTNYSGTTNTLEVTGAPEDAGYGFSPLSETDSVIPSSVTIERRINGQRHQATGARGKVNLKLTHGDPLLLDYEFLGAPVLDFADPTKPTPNLAGPMTGITYPLAPPTVAGHGFPFLLDVYSPIATQLAVNVNNTLAPRKTIGASDLQRSGYAPTRITDREITGSCDPEHPVKATYDFVSKYITGATHRLSIQVGTRGSQSGLVVVYAPAAQMQGDFQHGERDKMLTNNLDLVLSGSADDELRIWHVFA